MTTIITAALVLLPWNEPTGSVYLVGQATYYSDGVMETVAVNRGHIASPDLYGAWLQVNGLTGAIAGNRAGDLGRRVWIHGPDGLEGPFLVIDCAQRGPHYEAREAAGRVIEVDYPTAVAWDMAGPIPVVVLFSEPERMETIR